MALLLSGGVDSAVAALRLRRDGHDVAALTLRLSDPDGDATDRAAAVARRLDLPWHTADFREAFAALVREPFVDAYREGRTPNPCVGCNPAVKFGLAWTWARERLGAERLATGHYARLAAAPGGARVGRAACRARDQSYFLYRVPPERWRDVLLPLGDVPDKDTVRREARDAGLPVADDDDSMDICFLPGGDYRTLLPPAADGPPGVFVDADGRVLGRHRGHAHFTVGQRRGLGVALGEPAYVVAIRPDENAVVLGRRADALRREVWARAPVYAAAPPPAGVRAWGRIRSGGEPAACTVLRADAETLAARFDAPVFAPAPGQHLVLYNQEGWVLGGGELVGARRA